MLAESDKNKYEMSETNIENLAYESKMINIVIGKVHQIYTDVTSDDDDLSYYTYIDNICFLYGANKKIKKFYGCYFSIDKMSSNELEKMEQFLNSKNLRPRSLLF